MASNWPWHDLPLNQKRPFCDPDRTLTWPWDEPKESLYIGEPMREQKNLVISGYGVEFDKVPRQGIQQKFPLEKLKKSMYSHQHFLPWTSKNKK